MAPAFTSFDVNVTVQCYGVIVSCVSTALTMFMLVTVMYIKKIAVNSDYDYDYNNMSFYNFRLSETPSCPLKTYG